MKVSSIRAAQRALVFVLVGAFALVNGVALVSNRSVVPERDVAHRPIQVAEDGYVSSGTCRACHPSQYESWRASYHRTMTQLATPASVATSFDNIKVSDVYGAPIRLERRGAEFWSEFDDPDAVSDGRVAGRIERQIVMITGSHHQQVYWYRTGNNRLLGQLPAIYMLEERRWIPRRAAVLHPPSDPPFSETGHWNSVCVSCHTTNGKPGFDTPFGSRPIEAQMVDTKVTEFGIACEACHGPGDTHARVNRNPLRRYLWHLSDTPDSTVVQPLRLNPQRSSQVCGQCHGVWEFYDRDGERRANSGGLPYRPGDDLVSTRFMARPTTNANSPTMQALVADDAGFIKDSFWSDGMVRVTGREYNGLIDSPCFKNAVEDRRTMSCFSCHAMHKPTDDSRADKEWADDQITPGMGGNKACTQCHPSFAANLPAHTKHSTDSAGSSCYNCHMPFTSYGLLKTIRSHQVSSPSAASSVETGRPNACNLCHLDKTLAWTSDYLQRWYGTPPAALSADDTTIAASLLWLLRGDAGQRAIVAQSMGWMPAQRTSRAASMAPYLAQLLDDPYDAVRFIAARSLRSLPGFGAFQYDFVAPSKQRFDAQLRAMAAWDRTRRPEDRRRDPELLLDSHGNVDIDAVRRLLRERDTRRVLLRE